MSAVPPPIETPAVALPDRDFESARSAAIEVVADRASTTWTDHNVSDPGVTLLEAVAWGNADLHFRTGSRDLGAWPLEVPVNALPQEPHWSGVPLASDAAGLLDLAVRLAERGSDSRPVASHLRDAIANATSSQTAAAAIAGRVFAAPSAGAPPFSWAQAAGAVRLLRGPVVLRAALDGSALVAGAIESAGSDDTRAAELLRRETSLDEIWDDELAGLIRRERRRERGRAVAEMRERIAAMTDPAAMLTALQEIEGLTAAEARIARALHPCPQGLAPEHWEVEERDHAHTPAQREIHPHGQTRIWPPHPVQVRTCEPVTADDYARRARTATGVRRAWVVPRVVLPGIAWDGSIVAPPAAGDPFLERAGVVTLLVEPVNPPAAAAKPAFLRAVLRTVLGEPVPRATPPAADGRLPDDRAELDAPFQLWRADLDAAAPRRTLCDELGVALLDRCPITLKGVIHAPAGTDRAALLERARDRVAAFFTEGRPESRPPAEEILTCPSGIEGSWPPVPQPADGWIPGDAIRLSELVQCLSDEPSVLGIEGLQLAVGDGPWLPNPGITGHVDLPPNCIPVLSSRNCMQVTLELASECGRG